LQTLVKDDIVQISEGELQGSAVVEIVNRFKQVLTINIEEISKEIYKKNLTSLVVV
jgi:transcription antitermination factor NusG